jgi:hypothetical protein
VVRRGTFLSFLHCVKKSITNANVQMSILLTGFIGIKFNFVKSAMANGLNFPPAKTIIAVDRAKYETFVLIFFIFAIFGYVV